MPGNSILIIGSVVLVVVVVVAAYFLMKSNNTTSCPKTSCPNPNSTCPRQACPTCPDCPPSPTCPTCPVCPVVNNFPTSSGNFYIQSKASGLYLNANGNMEQSKDDATVFHWDSGSGIISPRIAKLNFDVQATPTDAGIILSEFGHVGTTFSLASSSGVKALSPKTSDTISDGIRAVNTTVLSLQPITCYANFIVADSKTS